MPQYIHFCHLKAQRIYGLVQWSSASRLRALCASVMLFAFACTVTPATAADPTSKATTLAPSNSTATSGTTIATSSHSTDTTMSKANPLPVGAPAPAFTYRTADGTEHSSTDLQGKPFVVYFYPKDNTPGCTTQACGFRDSYADYEKSGLAVIGVSADSEESHSKFRSKHELPFGLVSDPERTVIEAYGVWGPKLFMGKSFLGINRMSFLVGPDGKIAKVYPKVKVADHAETVLADARELGLISN